jgi:hypothetical protein
MIDVMASFDEVNDLVGLRDADQWERRISKDITQQAEPGS